MPRLRNRQIYPPGGFKFLQPETGWQPANNMSFNALVFELIRHRNANPHLRDSRGWATDLLQVENEVDTYNALICEQAGWTDYIQAPIGTAAPPFFPAPSRIDQSKVSAAAGAVKKIWAGVRTLDDWLDSGEPAVEPAKSAARAAVCANCPKNGQGDFTTWFTAPASLAIKRLLERALERKLSTPSDERVNICEVCLCPMKLKVHTPISFINGHLKEDVLRELEAVPGCWIVAERRA